MNLPELAAYVALIADDAERRFGPDANPALREAYVHEAVLDLWLTQPGVTVATAHRMLRQVHHELRRRWSQRMEQQAEQQVAIVALPAELWPPSGHCPNHRSTRDLPRAANPDSQSCQREAECTERKGILAARQSISSSPRFFRERENQGESMNSLSFDAVTRKSILSAPYRISLSALGAAADFFEATGCSGTVEVNQKVGNGNV